jgi:hypothetical protein
MKTMNAIQTADSLNNRFSDLELFRMFNVDCNPTCDGRKVRTKTVDAPYVFNDIKVPLLVSRKRKASKRVRHYDDQIKAGVTNSEPGTKARVADLAKFYAANMESETSAFNV